jgi:hypothetical protein
LHCLSVLNLIYHGNFDYPLNPWCTSFAGDSGVGKSMIADLLQLIFVGKEAYKSATHAQGARPPEGLVLDDATSGGKGLGYAFLTVEVGAGRFLVVGCYLAAAAKTVVPFIVQQGISFAHKPHRLQPLDRPLGYRDLLPASGQVLPLADMPAHMQQQQVYIKFFEHRLSDFHRLLFDNELLPLDVNQPGVLKNYANIIRSFSRSGDLDQHKNKDDLKRFLFGEEAQRSIWHDYQERVKEIEQQLTDYRANDGRAKDLERKLTRFHGLHTKHQTAQQAQAAWRLAQAAYWQGETQRAEAALALATSQALATEAGHWQLQHAKSQVEAATAEQSYQRYADLLATQQQLLRDTKAQQQQATQARQQLDHWQPAADQARRYAQAVAEATAWLGRYDSLEALREAQQQHQQLRHEHALLQRLAAHLQAHGQAADFPQSGWASAASPAAAEAALETLRQEVATSRQQHVFTDLTSADSLAGWAFRRGVPLSLAEESILTHFGRQAARRGEETEPNYYLHDRDELFASLLETVEGEHNPGFWLHLRGVRGWVPRLAEADRAFFDADKVRLTALFAARQQASQRDLRQLTARLDREEALQAILHELPDWPAALAAYPRREAIGRAMQETAP